jgi:hypothetical protein
LEEIAHLAAYSTTVLQSSRSDDKNGTDPQFGAVSAIVLPEASMHVPQGYHAVLTLPFFVRTNASLDFRRFP